MQANHEAFQMLSSVGPFPMCTPMASGSNPPPGIFDWVDSAVYQGRTSQLVLGVSLDVWASNISVGHQFEQ